VAKRGGIRFARRHCPNTRRRSGAIRRLIDDWSVRPVKAVVFQTGVGARALFDTTDALGLTQHFLQLLAGSVVVVRGPKPTGVLRGRNVRMDCSAEEPYTTTEVLKAIEGIELVVKKCGATLRGDDTALEEALQQRGATVIEIRLTAGRCQRHGADRAPDRCARPPRDRRGGFYQCFTGLQLFSVSRRSASTRACGRRST